MIYPTDWSETAQRLGSALHRAECEDLSAAAAVHETYRVHAEYK